MAGQDRLTSDALRARLAAGPHAFDLFALMRRIEAAYERASRNALPRRWEARFAPTQDRVSTSCTFRPRNVHEVHTGCLEPVEGGLGTVSRGGGGGDPHAHARSDLHGQPVGVRGGS